MAWRRRLGILQSLTTGLRCEREPGRHSLGIAGYESQRRRTGQTLGDQGTESLRNLAARGVRRSRPESTDALVRIGPLAPSP
jgi:hypothetical protein